jgi:hypothetical protein
MTRRGRITKTGTTTGIAPVWALAGALLAGATLAVGCLKALEARAPEAGGAPPDLPAIFTAHQMAALSGGFAPALADVYWIRVAAVSADELDGPAADRLYDLVDHVTTLDPKFAPAYHQGALLLSIAARRPDLSDKVLEKARAEFPGQWVFPFYLGFNAFYHRTDFPQAAVYMAEAAGLPGAPPYLNSLARRFADETTNREVARELLDRMLRATQDPVIHQRLLERMREMGFAS